MTSPAFCLHSSFHQSAKQRQANQVEILPWILHTCSLRGIETTVVGVEVVTHHVTGSNVQTSRAVEAELVRQAAENRIRTITFSEDLEQNEY